MDDAARVLVLDDDAITLRFFEAALSAMNVAFVGVENASDALRASKSQTFALYLIDRHLPDMSGESLLAALRENGATAPAVATTAELDSEARGAMLDAGFDDVVAKPLSVEQIQSVIARYLQSARVLDDDAALRSIGGCRESLMALRGLLAKELDEFVGLYGDISEWRSVAFLGRLHRLSASCGFCGASALAGATTSLQRALRGDEKFDGEAFLRTCRTTAEALRS